jgi:hypothetical protein
LGYRRRRPRCDRALPLLVLSSERVARPFGVWATPTRSHVQDCTTHIQDCTTHIQGCTTHVQGCTTHVRFAQLRFGLHDSRSVCTTHVRFAQLTFGLHKDTETPKAFANSSPGLELATTLGHVRQKEFNAVGVGKGSRVSERFQRWCVFFLLNPGLEQPWAGICELRWSSSVKLGWSSNVKLGWSSNVKLGWSSNVNSVGVLTSTRLEL